MKRLFALALLTSALPVHGATCALDAGPAATLLLPYFELDLADANGRTTLISINNASEWGVLAHVVLWTDLAVPTLGFDVFLTGWDVQTVNLRDLFQGKLPRTADHFHDPADTISPAGPFSEDASHPGCSALPPQDLAAGLVDQLRRAHTGQSPLLNQECVARNLGQPTVARGYATIDLVKDCTTLRPTDAGYFGPAGVALTENVLWGDFFYVDPAGQFSQGESLVRIQADPAKFSPGSTTFYGRYVNGSAADAREPLPAAWAARFLLGGGFDGGTSLVVWRSLPLSGQPFACSAMPPGLPRSQKALIAFNEEEELYDLNNPPPLPIDPQPPRPLPVPFSAAATRVAIGGAAAPVPFNFGWFQMDLRPHATEPADPYAQAWVGEIHSAQGRYSVGLDATQLDSLCTPDRCSEGSSTEIGELCVVGPLQTDQPAHFRVRPKGCFSSSCTQIFHAGCAVQRGPERPVGALYPELLLDALFCLQPKNEPVCTPDCNGGSFAECASGALATGSYAAKLGSLVLNFQVPGEGACVGTP
jgi:hypothetical protein